MLGGGCSVGGHRQFIIRLHEWLVAPVCEVEGHIKKVDDLYVSFVCDFNAVRFEHLADFLFSFFNFFWSGLANCEAITVKTNFIYIYIYTSTVLKISGKGRSFTGET